MIKQHPLTDEIISKQFGRYDGIDDVMVYDEDDVRTAYDLGRDEQCEQVIRWLYDNLDEYSTDADPGFFLPMWRLISDLELAMLSLQEREQPKKKTGPPIYCEQEQEIRELKRQLHEKDITIHNVIKKLKDHGIC